MHQHAPNVECSKRRTSYIWPQVLFWCCEAFLFILKCLQVHRPLHAELRRTGATLVSYS